MTSQRNEIRKENGMIYEQIWQSANKQIQSRYSNSVNLICVIAALGGFLWGYDVGTFGGAQIFVRQYFQLGPLAFGCVVSALMFGCLLATIGGARIQEWLGASNCLSLAAVLFVAGSLGASLASSATVLVLFRLVSGVATGIISVAAPMYIAEMAPPARRGRLVSLFQFALGVGALLGMVMGWVFANTLAPELAWRCLLGSTAVPSLVLLLLLTKIPPSPRWLLTHGRETEAVAVMQTIRGPEQIAGELAAIRASAGGLLQKASGMMGVSYRDLLRPGIRWALLTGVLLGVFGNWTGGTSMGSYLPTLIQQHGYPAADDALAVWLLMTCVGLPESVLAIWLVDHVDRRTLWISAAGGMTVSIAMLGWACHVGVTGPAMIGLMFLVNLCHGLGLAPLPWLMISELYSGPSRVRAISVCTTVLWLSGFTCVLAFPPLVAWSERLIGSAAGAFWVSAGISLLAVFFGWWLLPETRGRTLEEIAQSRQPTA